jgi:hypothetical protein
MTAPRIPQVNFSKGELGPYLFGRFDVESYAGALAKARNVYVMKYGGVCKRPGTWLVGEVIGEGYPVRLIPFQFSLTQAYALEFGNGYIAPCLQGGRLLEGELAITGISNATNAEITVAYHGYSVGDYVFLQGITGAEPDLGNLLNDRTVEIVSVVDANHFTIDVDTSGVSAFVSCTGGTTNTSAPAAPTVPTVGSTTPVTVSGTSGTGVSPGGGMGNTLRQQNHA